MISAKEKYEIYRPKKFLGQNFLVDENIARKIVNSLGIKKGDTVVEIGPGQGSLTKYLCGLTDNFYSIEVDKSIFEKLTLEYGERIKLIHKDFLKIDFEKEIKSSSAKLKIIGNIPYNITTEILFKLFDSYEKIDSAVLMMQKEVAQRLTAVPNTKDYGILAIQTQLYTTPKILFNVPPTAFFPKPNVNSSVVKLNLNASDPGIKDRNLFKEIVRGSFGQRRKTMRNSLKKIFEKNEIDFTKVDFDFSRRPENVTVKEFKDLSGQIYKLIISS